MAIDIEEDEEDAFDFPNTVSDGMRKLVVWMMQPKRKARPQNVDELLAEKSKSKVEKVKVVQRKEYDNEETILSTNPEINAEETILEAKQPEQKESDIEVYDERNVKCIDLGLSVKWASCNIGANPMTPQGGLYGWGDPVGNIKTKKIEDYLEYRGGMYLATPHNISGTKYDIASYHWGKEWRIPDRVQWKELVTKCIWTYEKYKEIEGYRVKGPSGNSIFLPLTGMREENKISNSSIIGCYWTSEIVEYENSSAYYYFFNWKKNNDIVSTRQNIYIGLAVRPICDKEDY